MNNDRLNDAVFYRATEELNTYEKHVPAPYVRYEFKADPDSKYRLTVSGLGFYELFVNGKNITKGVLAPYISNPDDLVYFDEYDVSGFVSGGTLAVGLVLGNGMLNAPGGRVWDFDIAKFRNVPCFAALLTRAGADGTEETEDIGSRFVSHPSPILFDDIRSGCFYNANLECPGWASPGYDDGAWSPVKKAEIPRGERRICEADPIAVTEERRARAIRKAVMDPRFDNRGNMRLDTEYKFDCKGKEGVLFDFGINTTGLCRLKLNGKKGQRVYIQFCEYMTSAGEPSVINSGSFYPYGYSQALLYICKGEAEETFVPSFCYYGYQYAMVFGLEEEQIGEDTLTMLRASSDLKDRGGFTCSDPVMNALGDMVRTSDLSNFWFFPTDCPHREKNGWTGDAAVSAERVLLTLTPEKSYREWVRNICASQRPNGALPGIVPTGGWGFRWGNGPAWDNVLSEICWQAYRLRGDLSIAREASDALFSYLNYLTKLRDEDGLISYGLGDWLQPGRGADHPVAPTLLTSSIMGLYIASKSADLFGALGLPLQKGFALRLKEELISAVRAHFIDFASSAVSPRCQTAQAMCIYYGVFTEDEKAAAAKVLADIVRECGGHLDCGMLGLRVVFHVLSDFGYGDLAYQMITRTDYPSYGMFVKRGHTSLPEDFRPDSEIDEPNSLNHHFFGDIKSWFIQKAAGLCVNPDNTDPNELLICPDFLQALTFAEAHYDSLCGRAGVRWEKTAAGVLLTVSVPEGLSGAVRLPAGWTFDDGQTKKPLASGAYECVRKE